MTEDFAKKIEDLSSDDSIKVEGQNYPKWNRKDSGMRRVKSILPDGEPSRISHVKVTADEAVVMTEEEYIDYLREHVRDKTEKELISSRLELTALNSRMMRIRRRIEKLNDRIQVLDPLLERMEKEYGKDTIPAKSADVGVGEGILTVESASEFLLSGFNERKGRVICAGIQEITVEGAEMIASWHGTLHFPEMNASSFDQALRETFLRGNVDAVFAGDNPVITRKQKDEFNQD